MMDRKPLPRPATYRCAIQEPQWAEVTLKLRWCVPGRNPLQLIPLNSRNGLGLSSRYPCFHFHQLAVTVHGFCR